MANDYLEVARALQGRLRGLTAPEDSSNLRTVLEIAAEEFGILREEYCSKRRKASLMEEARDHVAEEASCRHSCSEHEEVMNADRWGNLPEDLLPLVLAHLPVKNILQLPCLSKVWKESMMTRGSVFFRVCDEVHPKIFAFIRYLGDSSRRETLFLVRVFDTNWNRWHTFQFSLGNPEAGWSHLKRYRGSFKHVGSDGGLVLFYLEAHNTKKKVANICVFYTVVNPLTQRSFDLPPILDVKDVYLQRIVVDWETNHYKVLIVVDINTDDIRVFDSSTGEWSQPNKAMDITFGNQSAYDFAKGQIMWLHNRSSLPDVDAVTYTFLKNHLFVMLEDAHIPGVDGPTYLPLTKVYNIKEYVVEYHPQHPPTWVEMDIHRCGPFERAPKKNHYSLMLHSSNGVLIVFVAPNEMEPFRNDKGWIYDLSTRTWRDLPKLPGSHVTRGDRPCEIRWNAHP